VVDAMRSSKVSTGIVSLVELINSSGAAIEPAEDEKGAPKKSMMSGFKSLLAKK
jgi:hypothetical protein